MITKERYELLLRKMLTYILLKFYTNPTYNENTCDFEITLARVGLPDCEEIVDFAKRNNLNFLFRPSGHQIIVKFWHYNHRHENHT